MSKPASTDKRTCIGFGSYEHKCSNVAGTPWTDHWCMRCDELRRAHITKQLEHILDTWPEAR